MALQESRVVTRWQESQDRWSGGIAQVTDWPAPVQHLEADVGPAARSREKPIRTHVPRPTRPPLLYFPAVLPVQSVRIKLLTCW